MIKKNILTIIFFVLNTKNITKIFNGTIGVANGNIVYYLISFYYW